MGYERELECARFAPPAPCPAAAPLRLAAGTGEPTRDTKHPTPDTRICCYVRRADPVPDARHRSSINRVTTFITRCVFAYT
ncbi:jg20453 [Pararge aegeria aegeria]|nr:jg20453 [Pararge aegeria aegeria]